MISNTNDFVVFQLLAITLRADIPLGIDLLSVFWKNLVGVELDPITDLQEADILTYNYIKKIEMVSFTKLILLVISRSALNLCWFYLMFFTSRLRRKKSYRRCTLSMRQGSSIWR